MKRYFINSTFATLFSIVLLTGCKKDVPGFTSNLKTNSKAGINKSSGNTFTTNNAISMASAKPKGGIVIWPDTLKKNP